MEGIPSPRPQKERSVSMSTIRHPNKVKNKCEQQTKDKIERWMAQVRVERSEAEFLQVRMQKNKNEHDATALQALQAAEQARKRAAAATPIGTATAERARTTADLQRLRYLDSAAGEVLVSFHFSC